MLIKKTLLTLMALFMAASGMPVYAEQVPEPEVTERKDDTAASTEAESTLGIKKIYAEEPGTLITGKEFNAAIKTLAAGADKKYWAIDSLIQAIQVAKALPSEGITTKDVSAKNYEGSYLVWWDAGTSTIYLYSKSGKIVLNPDSSDMFYNCRSLTTLDVSNWDTSQVTNMNQMFEGCSKLTALNVSKWDTGSVTNMKNMFWECKKLTTLDVSNWNTDRVTNMDSMFCKCFSLPSLDVSNWNTGSVTNMDGMFSYCTKLPNFNSNVVDKTNAYAGSGGYMTLKS